MKTQAAQRAAKRQKKTDERSNDTTGDRGFSTDQRISIESMNINKKRLEHQQHETRLVGLSIQGSAIRSQIESAEKRAELRCPTYDENNKFWKRVDELLEQQSDVVRSIREYSDSLISPAATKTANPQVSEFLNQPSPIKKSKPSNEVGKTKGEVLVLDDDTSVSDESTDDDTRLSRIRSKPVTRASRSKSSKAKVSE